MKCVCETDIFACTNIAKRTPHMLTHTHRYDLVSACFLAAFDMRNGIGLTVVGFEPLLLLILILGLGLGPMACFVMTKPTESLIQTVIIHTFCIIIQNLNLSTFQSKPTVVVFSKPFYT